MSLLRPPLSMAQIPEILFKKIHRINEQALKAPREKQNVMRHLSNVHEAYNYVYYVYLVDKVLEMEKGVIVDWGGFCGQVTILLNSLGYNCENYGLYYPSQKKLFDEFGMKYRVGTNPKKLPYKDNSCLALISSGVLEHVGETDMTDKEALKEIYRVLKPGGYFFCWNLPRKFALVEMLASLRNKNVHPVRYTKRHFQTMLKEAGFKLKYFDAHGDVLKMKWARKLLYKFNPWTGLVVDYYASKLPFINFFAHHITVVARKPIL